MQVCGIRDQRGGIRDQEGGIWEHNPRIKDHKPWDRIRSFLRVQGLGCTVNVGSGTKIYHSIGIKDQKFGYKNGIRNEKSHFVMTLCRLLMLLICSSSSAA